MVRKSRQTTTSSDDKLTVDEAKCEEIRSAAARHDMEAVAITASACLTGDGRWLARIAVARYLRLAGNVRAMGLLLEQVDDLDQRVDMACVTPGGALEALELARELSAVGELRIAAIAASVACDDAAHYEADLLRMTIQAQGVSAWPQSGDVWLSMHRHWLDRPQLSDQPDSGPYSRRPNAQAVDDFAPLKHAFDVASGGSVDVPPELRRRSLPTAALVTAAAWAVRWAPGRFRDMVLKVAVQRAAATCVERDREADIERESSEEAGFGGQYPSRSAWWGDTRDLCQIIVWILSTGSTGPTPEWVAEALESSLTESSATRDLMLEVHGLLTRCKAESTEWTATRLRGLTPEYESAAAWLNLGAEPDLRSARALARAPSFLALGSDDGRRGLALSLARTPAPEFEFMTDLTIAAMVTLADDPNAVLTGIIPVAVRAPGMCQWV